MIKISFNQDPVHTTAEWHLGNNKEDIVFTVVRQHVMYHIPTS